MHVTSVTSSRCCQGDMTHTSPKGIARAYLLKGNDLWQVHNQGNIQILYQYLSPSYSSSEAVISES